MIEKLQVSFPVAKVAPPPKDGVTLANSRVIVDFDGSGKAAYAIVNYNIVASDNTVVETDNATVELAGNQGETLTTTLLSALKAAIESADVKVKR